MESDIETEWATVDFMNMQVKCLPDRKKRLEDCYRDLARIPPAIDKRIRRVLALGDEFGHFATFCAKRWPRAWLDVPVAALSEIKLWENIPPGCKVLEITSGSALDLSVYDVVRIASPEWLPLTRAATGWRFIGQSLIRWNS